MSVIASRVVPASRRAQREERDRGYRPDIQALRALAVLAVTLFHLWPNRITGGYVGVDVFFVISGNLITTHLLRELRATGRVRLGRFWTRRARRLLPAALLTLGVTAIASLLVLPHTVLAQAMREVLASVFYVQNWALAASSVDYMAEDNIASPVQHFWTLSVEEQFYIGLPLVLVAVALVARRRAARAGLVLLGALALGSFVLSIWQTAWSPGDAYFSTLTRLWEFAVGGLIGAVPVISRWRALPTLVGLGMILAAVFLFTAGTPFPGYAAALPVLGTALVLWAGAGTVASRVGRIGIVAFFGRISYALYLWHWPPIVLVPYITGHPLTSLEKVAIFVAAVLAAWLSTTLWEDPIRFSPRLLGAARPRVVALWMAGAMILVAALPAATLLVVARQADDRAALALELTRGEEPCFGAWALADPECDPVPLGDVLIPDPVDAADDVEPRPDCWQNGTSNELRVCTIGPRENYERFIMVVGDSHGKALLGALKVIAEQHNWRIDLTGRAACYWTTHDLLQKSERLTEGCAEWRGSLAAHIDGTEGLDAIVTAKARRELDVETATPDPDRAFEEIVEGMASAWNGRRDLDVPVIALVDNPRLPKSAVDCVVEHGSEAREACVFPRSEVFPPDGVSEAAERAENAHAIDLTDFYCGPEVCHTVIGSAVVYRDGRHLTDTYSATLGPFLAREIDQVLAHR